MIGRNRSMSKNSKSRSNKLHANYDYENFYDKETGEINQQFLQDVMRPVKGFKYARAEINSGNQLEVEIYPSFRKQLPDMIKRFMGKKRKESTEARKNLTDRNSRKKLMRLVHENFYEGDYWMTLTYEKYPSFRKQLPDMIKRFMGKKRKESTEARKNLNDRNSRKKLMRLVHENFYEGDYWMTLTYEKDPKDLDEAKKLANYFFRSINRLRKKKGLERAKYVYVIEEGTYGTERFHIHAVMDNGLSKDEVEEKWIYGMTNIKTMKYRGKEENEEGTYGTERFHIHAVMDNGLSKDEVEEKWIYGMTNIKTMKYRGKEENFLGITGYMVKDPKVYKKTAFRLKGARTWARSKGNLIVPEPRVNKGKYSKRKITELALNHSELVEFLIAEYPQYDFKEVEVRHNDYNGLFYIYARMQDKNKRGLQRIILYLCSYAR